VGKEGWRFIEKEKCTLPSGNRNAENMREIKKETNSMRAPASSPSPGGKETSERLSTAGEGGNPRMGKGRVITDVEGEGEDPNLKPIRTEMGVEGSISHFAAAVFKKRKKKERDE